MTRMAILYFGMATIINTIGASIMFGQQKSDADLLADYGQLRAEHLAFDYTLSVYHKSYTSSDTLVNIANVKLVRNEADTILGGYVSLSFDTSWYGYNGDNILVGDFKKSDLLLIDAHKHPNAYFKGSSIGDFVDKGFLQKSPGPILLYNDSTIRHEVKDSVFHGVPSRVFIFHLPDQGDFYDQQIVVALDPVTLHVQFRQFSIWFQDNEQYTLWEYSNPQYHSDSYIEEFDSTFLSQFKIVSEYQLIGDDTFERKEFPFEKITGKVLTQKDSIRINNVDAKFIILDFWYTACYPCIKSIPSVNKIAEKYAGSDVQVFGVNPIDNESKDMARLMKFIQNNPMSYNTIMLDSAIKPKLKLEGYPTFIILDKDLNVIYMEVGFSETLFEEVSAFLDARL